MKKIFHLLISVLLISACSNGEDPEFDTELNGSWYLTDVSCFCGFDPEINFNDFTLSFNDSKQTVSIDNPPGDYYYITESGSYNYTISNNIISLEGVPHSYKYSIENNNLTLEKIDDPQIADDELTLIYKRS